MATPFQGMLTVQDCVCQCSYVICAVAVAAVLYHFILDGADKSVSFRISSQAEAYKMLLLTGLRPANGNAQSQPMHSLAKYTLVACNCAIIRSYGE